MTNSNCSFLSSCLSYQTSTQEILKLKKYCTQEYLLLFMRGNNVTPVPWGIERMIQVAQNTRASFVYADGYIIRNGESIPHPTIDYQEGSLRDDFDFGFLCLIDTKAFTEIIQEFPAYQYAAFYELRLRLSQKGPIIHIPEYLYSVNEALENDSEKQMFAYVDPKNREVQLEMEKACTAHLKRIGAWLAPCFKDVNLEEGAFDVEASVVIPVKNRAKTIADAVHSAFQQQTDFPFNVIVVDNYSTDGTGEVLASLTQRYGNLVVLQPSSRLQGIGGCWNEAVFNSQCGKFAIQLDSDDLFNQPDVLQNIVNTFYKENCAMVIGSYQTVNFKLEEVAPGLVDHAEWTPDNGRNNALRINGLGAPRAFFTPIIRRNPFPASSYGEDYAVGLAISRNYRIGRIYTSLYYCRRWEGNSDAAIDIQKLNSYNSYKDRLRSIELNARILLNHKSNEQ